jgi:MFS family permease
MIRNHAMEVSSNELLWLVTAGIVFGWPAMQRILQRENIYGELCPGILVSKCDEATIKYNAIFNAGSFGSTGGALLFGIFFDKFGPRSSSVLGHATLLLGLLLFAFSSNDRTCLLLRSCVLGHAVCHVCPIVSVPVDLDAVVDMFLPAYLFIGLAGSTIQLAVLPVCNEFKHPSIFLTTYSAIYAGSALIFTVFEVRSRLLPHRYMSQLRCFCCGCPRWCQNRAAMATNPFS